MNPAPPVTSACLLKVTLPDLADKCWMVLHLLLNEDFVGVGFLRSLPGQPFVVQIHDKDDALRDEAQEPSDHRRYRCDTYHVPYSIAPPGAIEGASLPRIDV